MRSLLMIIALSLTFTQPAAAADPFVVYTSKLSFDDVIDNLKLAIQERGMIINNELQMAEMLDRTGKDLGFEKKIYRDAISIDFCSSVLSRKMTEEDPRRIVNCPFIVTVYVLPDDPDTTYVVHRRLGDPDGPGVMGEVASMLKAVSEAATTDW